MLALLSIDSFVITVVVREYIQVLILAHPSFVHFLNEWVLCFVLAWVRALVLHLETLNLILENRLSIGLIF